MADLDVVPKHRSSMTWLWIVIALVVIVALWFAFSGRSQQPSRTGQLAVPTAPVVTVPAAAQT
jgi:bacteriorhodopsin